MITYRNIEIKGLEKIYDLDMSEHIDEAYVLRDGELKIYPNVLDLPNWDEEKREKIKTKIEKVMNEKGAVLGAFEENILVGIVSLSKKIISGNRVQLVTLHIDKSHRGMGIGNKLFDLIVKEAKVLNVAGIYISASPKKNTVDFYLRKGCVLTKNIDEELLKEEPEDIHMEYLF